MIDPGAVKRNQVALAGMQVEVADRDKVALEGKREPLQVGLVLDRLPGNEKESTRDDGDESTEVLRQAIEEALYLFRRLLKMTSVSFPEDRVTIASRSSRS